MRIIYPNAQMSCLFYEATEKIAETPAIIRNFVEARKVYIEVKPGNSDEDGEICNWLNAKNRFALCFKGINA